MTRWRVDFSHGYVSFDEADKEKAYEIFETDPNAIRLRKCEDIFDEGIVVAGAFLYEDISTVFSGSLCPN